MDKLITFAERTNAWELSFTIPEGSTETLLEITTPGQAVLNVSANETLTARIFTKWNQTSPRYGENPDFSFVLTSPIPAGSIRLCWRGYSFRLYVDERLVDEDWPLGEPADGDWCIHTADCITDAAFCPCTAGEPDPEETFTAPFQNFVLPGHNTGVGDCMPFARDGRYCLYYLFDRRMHASKQGLGAHQWAQISSADLKTWTVHPMAVGITEQWEGSICTGSLIQKEGKTYAFYAVRMSDGSPARMTWAVSDDGVRFTKSGKYFALTEPYEPVSARDPMVFLGADGQYHMLVTTNLVDAGSYSGCLAHLTSTDLTDWTQHEPFIVPGYSDQPECSDYFEWNGWYYLVFSNFAIARYRMSRNPFGPWLRPENDELDALEIQVPKTAAFGDRRFSTGFLARRPRTYAGNAVTHELFQRADGTLGVKPLEEILPPVREVHSIDDLFIDAGQNRACARLPQADGSFRLKATLRIEGTTALAGLVLGFKHPQGDRLYRIEFDPAARSTVIVRPNDDFNRGHGRDLLRNIDLSGDIAIDLMVCGDILDLMLPDGRCMTMRLDDRADQGAAIELYAISGAVSVRSIELETL